MMWRAAGCQCDVQELRNKLVQAFYHAVVYRGANIDKEQLHEAPAGTLTALSDALPTFCAHFGAVHADTWDSLPLELQKPLVERLMYVLREVRSPSAGPAGAVRCDRAVSPPLAPAGP